MNTLIKRLKKIRSSNIKDSEIIRSGSKIYNILLQTIMSLSASFLVKSETYSSDIDKSNFAFDTR